MTVVVDTPTAEHDPYRVRGSRSSSASPLAEHPAAAVEDAGAKVLVEVAEVPGDLVEDQRQAERQLLVPHTRVGGEDGCAAQVGGGLLDDAAIGSKLLV